MRDRRALVLVQALVALAQPSPPSCHVMKDGHATRAVVLALPSDSWPIIPTAGGLAPPRKIESDARVQVPRMVLDTLTHPGKPKSTAGGGERVESENKVACTRVVPATLPEGGGTPRRFPPGGGGTAEAILDIVPNLPPMVAS